MIISKKKYEKLNNDLAEAKAKLDDAKKALDDENKIMRVSLLIKEQRDDYKTQRDTLIDDIAVLRANNERLERENENLKQSVSEYKDYAESHVANYLELKALEHENRDLNHENKALRLQADTYFDEWQTVKNLYTTLTNHIRDMKFASPYSYNYIHLVNFIKELERE